MTYRQKYGKYDIRIDNMITCWFTTYENAFKEYKRLAKAPDELDGTLTLVNAKTGEVLACTEPEEE